MTDEQDIEVSSRDAAPDDFRAGIVTLAGQPNVGKSTLMNRILGEKVAITTSKPQTTRNRILGVKTWPEKGQICFVDTPGLHRSEKPLNRRMVQAALDGMSGVDLICHIVDAAALLGSRRRGDGRHWETEEFVFDRMGRAEHAVMLVINKIDRVDDKDLLLPLIVELDERFDYTEIVPVSALDGENVDRLIAVVLAQLPEQPPLFPEDMLTDKAERFIAAEFVREQIMDKTRREVPYSVAVEIERFAERPGDDLLEISAVIHVERDSQKGIIIGKGGRRLKAIGSAAREDLEEFFGRKIFLETFVRVQKEWSEDPRALSRFGYD